MKRLIVIVDDDNDFCQLVSEILKRRHYFTECVHTIAAAMQLKRLEPDFFILDNNLLDGLGLHAIKKLKEGLRNSKIIFSTADSAPTIETIAIANGADYFLCKPFKIADLDAILKSH